MKRWLLAAACVSVIAVALAAAPPLAEAVTGTPEAPAEAPPAAAVEPFGLGEIVSAVASSSARVTAAGRMAEDRRTLDELRASVAAIVREIETRSEATRQAVDDVPNLDLLADLEAEWVQRGRRLESLLKQAGLRAGNVTAVREELLRLRKRWEVTQTFAVFQEEPPETLRSIEESIERVRTARTALRAHLNELVALQTEISGASSVVAEALAAVRARRSAIRAALFRQDAPPIWRRARSGREATASPTELLGSLIGVYGDGLRRFADSRRGALVAVTLLVVACLVGTLRLRRRARAWREEGGAERLRLRMLAERPISTAFLLALVLSPLIVQDAPRVVQHGLELVLIVPLLRILLQLLPAQSHAYVFATGAFYLVDRARGVLAHAGELERWVFFVEVLLAAATAVAFLQSAAGRRITRDGLRIGARIGIVVLLASGAANAAGFVALARWLGDGALRSIYLSIAVFAALEVARSMVQAASHTRFAEALQAAGERGLRIEHRILTALRGLAVVAWAWLAVGAFELEDEVWQAGRAALDASVSFGEVAISLGDVMAFGLTLYGALLISRLLRFALEVEVYPRIELERGVPHAVSATLHYGLLLAGFYLAVAAAGVDLSRLTILIGALGVGIGFGLQNVVNNFVSGLILLYERPVQVGDAVEVGAVIGQVHRIGIRSSTVRTYQGAEVIVPNADLISNQVTNWTLSDRRRRVEIGVGVAYGTDPEKVRSILLEVARNHPRVATDPPPMAVFLRFGDSALEFQLRAWVDNMDDWLTTGSELHVAISRAFVEAGVEIPFPQRDLHIRSRPPAPCEEEG